ncbi:unnamed protein product [Psylliodes chrysocephalus]|uniref:Uncharacterized protein n=1 Tax=Psylliodes chrysocephalus TaxID=3402493 RepID=A0A9P0D562_9CUCU|nr:unnamed protein product [Psylliodes chrysocephala]
MSASNFSKNFYLLGHERKCLSQRKLPNIQEVLSFLMYNYKSLGKSLHNSIKIVIDEVNAIWSKTKIPVMKNPNSAEKLKNLYQKWIKIKKNRTHTKSISQKKKRRKFQGLFEKVI